MGEKKDIIGKEKILSEKKDIIGTVFYETTVVKKHTNILVQHFDGSKILRTGLALLLV